MYNQIEHPDELIIEAEKRGVKELLEHYYSLLDSLKYKDVPLIDISSKDIAEAVKGIKKGIPVIKALSLASDIENGEGIVRKKALSEFAGRLNKELRDVIKQNWGNGFCPVCGSLPSIGAMGEDNGGKMFLVCSQCEWKWDFNRLLCSVCLNRDQKGLGYFYSDGDEGCRANYCNACRGYLKVLDMRKAGKFHSFPVSDILTIPLDIIAQEQGYKRFAPNPLGMLVIK